MPEDHERILCTTPSACCELTGPLIAHARARVHGLPRWDPITKSCQRLAQLEAFDVKRPNETS